MLEIKIKDKHCELNMEGSTIELTVETLALLHSIYNAFHDDNEHAAEWFAQTVVREITNPDSIVFEPNEK